MSDSSVNTDSEESDKQLIFIHKLKENTVLFNKSQIPQIKKEKEMALETVTEHYGKIFSISVTKKQISKKISNMKAEVKKKFDMSKTGNKKIIYKPWEKMLMDILDVEKNPVFTKVPGAVSVGVNSVLNECKGSNVPSQSSEVPSVTPLKKRKISTSLPETSETKNLSNTELQRLVLLEQLQLIRLQKEKAKEQLKLIRAPKEKYIASDENNEPLYMDL